MDEQRNYVWLERIGIAAGSAGITIMIGMATLQKDIEKMAGYYVETKSQIAELRGDIKSLTAAVNNARLEDNKEIGRVDGRVLALETTVRTILKDKY